RQRIAALEAGNQRLRLVLRSLEGGPGQGQKLVHGLARDCVPERPRNVQSKLIPMTSDTYVPVGPVKRGGRGKNRGAWTPPGAGSRQAPDPSRQAPQPARPEQRKEAARS